MRADRRKRGQGRRLLGAGLAILGLLGLPSLEPARAAIPGGFCQGPDPIAVVGAITQTRHYIDHWIKTYEEQCSAVVGEIAYDPLGESAAAAAIVRHERGSDEQPWLLYATDLPLSKVEKYSAEQDVYHPFRPALLSFVAHFPTHVWGLAIGYNLSSCGVTQLKLSSRTLSLIYSGQITRWNDPLLVVGDPHQFNDDNPKLANCGLTIRVTIREGEAASSVLIKDYLRLENPVFEPYRAKELNQVWPPTLTNPCRALTESGVSTCLKSPGTIGYVRYEEAYANTGYRMALLENRAGELVGPATDISPTSSRTTWPDQCLIAAENTPMSMNVAPGLSTQLTTTSDWSDMTITTASAGYPLCAFGYALAFERMMQSYGGGIGSGAIRTAVDLLTVIAKDSSQAGLPSFRVSPLPPHVRTLVRDGITRIRW